MIGVDLNPEILQKRLKFLGWSTYRLAKEVARIRQEVYGETIKNPKGMVPGVASALKNPEKCSSKMLFCIIRALGGNLKVEWPIEKVTVTEELIEEQF